MMLLMILMVNVAIIFNDGDDDVDDDDGKFNLNYASVHVGYMFRTVKYLLKVNSVY